MELTEKQKQWQVHLEAAAENGESLASYARTHDLDVNKLYSYRSAIQARLAQGGIPTSAQPFVRVAPTASSTGVHVQLTNGVRLMVPNLNEPGLLERLAGL